MTPTGVGLGEVEDKMETIVQANGLTKIYTRADGTQVNAVQGIDFVIRKGEIFSLLGPNGAGKSTTISMISGLIPPTSGDATIGGFSITKQPLEAKGLLGFVPQDIALYPMLSARRNLEFFGRMYGMSGAELNRRIDEVLEIIDLKDRQNDRVDTFSGGMKRRVNIAVGLLHHPQLIYMDEPTVGVDPQSRRRILDTVLQLRDSYKMTVLYTTHLMEEAQELSDRIGIIDSGKIIALGTLTELMAQTGEEDRLILTIGAASVEPALVERLKSVSGVSRVLIDPKAEADAASSKLSVYARMGRKALPDVLRAADDAGVAVTSVAVKEPDLETLFLTLTGRALRE